MSGPPSAPLSSALRLVVGLGNPGEEYRGTRHNLGFEVLDRLAAGLGLRFSRQERERGLGPVKARVARGDAMDRAGNPAPFLLVKPWTWMNHSGAAAAAYARHFRIAPDSIFVIVDDLNLPLGRLRIRPGGGPGGHKGLESVLACLGTEGFPRLRIGIAEAGALASDMADPDFVLAAFSDEERELLEPALRDAVAATGAWLEGAALGDLMTAFNSRAARENGAAGLPGSD